MDPVPVVQGGWDCSVASRVCQALLVRAAVVHVSVRTKLGVTLFRVNVYVAQDGLDHHATNTAQRVPTGLNVRKSVTVKTKPLVLGLMEAAVAPRDGQACCVISNARPIGTVPPAATSVDARMTLDVTASREDVNVLMDGWV